MLPPHSLFEVWEKYYTIYYLKHIILRIFIINILFEMYSY